MNTIARLQPLWRFILIAVLAISPALSAQSAPAGETAPASTEKHREDALFIDAARPSGAYGMTDSKTPQDVWLGASESTIKLVAGILVGLLVLRWWWRRRSVNYA